VWSRKACVPSRHENPPLRCAFPGARRPYLPRLGQSLKADLERPGPGEWSADRVSYSGKRKMCLRPVPNIHSAERALTALWYANALKGPVGT